jgi:hypothetical protein
LRKLFIIAIQLVLLQGLFSATAQTNKDEVEWKPWLATPGFKMFGGRVIDKKFNCRLEEKPHGGYFHPCDHEGGWEVIANFNPGYVFVISIGELSRGTYAFEWNFRESAYSGVIFPDDASVNAATVYKTVHDSSMRLEIAAKKGGLEELRFKKALKPLESDADTSTVFNVGEGDEGKHWEFRIYTFGNLNMFLESAKLTCFGAKLCLSSIK